MYLGLNGEISEAECFEQCLQNENFYYFNTMKVLVKKTILYYCKKYPLAEKP